MEKSVHISQCFDGPSHIGSGIYRATRTIRAVRSTRSARATRSTDTVRLRLLPSLLPGPAETQMSMKSSWEYNGIRWENMEIYWDYNGKTHRHLIGL